MGIKVTGIYKTFGSHNEKNYREVLKGVDLSIENGEMIAICGKSGSGKSTLLHILGLLDEKDSGKYELDNREIVGSWQTKINSQIRNEKIGYVLQDFGLIEEETVFNNVSLPLMFSKKKINEIEEIVLDNLESVRMKDRAEDTVSNLSGGEKQRIAIARALAMNPDYILADEPTGALDAQNAAIVLKALTKLHEMGKTIIIVTHDPDIAAQCDRTLFLENGVLSLTNT